MSFTKNNKREIIIYTPTDTFLEDIHYKYCKYLLNGGPFFFFQTFIILKSLVEKKVLLPKSILELIFEYYNRAVINQDFILEYKVRYEVNIPCTNYNRIMYRSFNFEGYYGLDLGVPYSL
jgi:hypothetical protein